MGRILLLLVLLYIYGVKPSYYFGRVRIAVASVYKFVHRVTTHCSGCAGGVRFNTKASREMQFVIPVNIRAHTRERARAFS